MNPLRPEQPQVPRVLQVISALAINAAWLLFIGSFFLPATDVLQRSGTPPGTPLTGWQAFITSIVAGVMNPWLWIVEPRVFLFLAFLFGNGVMLVAPVLSRDESTMVALSLLPFGLLPWLIPAKLLGELYIDFYCWNASFFLMALGFFLASFALDTAATGVRFGSAKQLRTPSKEGYW